MDSDPYYWTQDNGAGAPVHFATTYKQLDMVRGGGRSDATQSGRGSCALLAAPPPLACRYWRG